MIPLRPVLLLALLPLAACGDHKIEFPTDDTGDDTDLPDTDPGDTDDSGDTADTDTGEPLPPGERFAGSRTVREADITLVSKNEMDATGWDHGLATVHDVDGDGADELLVASKNTQDGMGGWPGAVYLVSRPPPGTNMLTIARTTFVGDGYNHMFGTAVADIGDADGDGVRDIAISAPDEEGVVHVFRGPFAGGTVSANDSDTQLHGESGATYTGIMVRDAGDADGDGLADVLVGSYHADGCNDCGSIYLNFAAGSAGSSSVASDSFQVQGVGGRGPLSTAGVTADFDGDGALDLLIGAGDNDLGGAGIFYGPLGAGDVTLDEADAWFTGSSRSYAGLAVQGLDLDGDGYDELAAGGPYARDGGVNAGAVYIQPGSGTRYTGTTDLTAGTVLVGADSEYAGMRFGAPADVDHDGREDLLISGPYASGGGTTYLFYGDPVLSGTHVLSDVAAGFLGVEAGSMTGWALAAGDYDGDGAGDIALGSFVVVAPNTGGVYIFTGE